MLEKFSGKFRRCWKIPHQFSGSTNCYPCQGLGTLCQGKRPNSETFRKAVAVSEQRIQERSRISGQFLGALSMIDPRKSMRNFSGASKFLENFSLKLCRFYDNHSLANLAPVHMLPKHVSMSPWIGMGSTTTRERNLRIGGRCLHWISVFCAVNLFVAFSSFKQNV